MKNAEVEKIRLWSALVGQLGRSKNSRSQLKLILCCSLPNVIHHIKFHLNQMKNAEVENIRHWSALVGQLGRSKNGCSHLKCIPWYSLPNVIPHIKFHSNRMKTQKFEFLKWTNKYSTFWAKLVWWRSL